MVCVLYVVLTFIANVTFNTLNASKFDFEGRNTCACVLIRRKRTSLQKSIIEPYGAVFEFKGHAKMVILRQ